MKSFKKSILGKGISSGITEGIISNVNSAHDLSKVNGGIIATGSNDFMLITQLAFSKKYKGVILKKGSATSHAAVLLREGGVPAIVYEDDLEDGVKVSFDGSTGTGTISNE